MWKRHFRMRRICITVLLCFSMMADYRLEREICAKAFQAAGQEEILREAATTYSKRLRLAVRKANFQSASRA